MEAAIFIMTSEIGFEVNLRRERLQAMLARIAEAEKAEYGADSRSSDSGSVTPH